MDIVLDGEGPLTRQLHLALKKAVMSGRAGANGRLPGSRTLARSLGVSRNVVLHAFAQLEAEGLIAPKRGAGSFVVAPAPRRQEAKRIAATGPVRFSGFGQRALALSAHDVFPAKSARLKFDFQYRYVPPDQTSRRQWARLARAQLRRPVFDYADPMGLPALREAIALRVKRVRGIDADPSEILIVSGGQQGLDLAARVLVEPDDPVLIEEPHYQGARQSFAAAGARLVPLRFDEVSPLSGARGARLGYVTPARQFPTGTTLPLRRKLEFLSFCEREDVIALEDDYDTDYRFGAAPVEALRALGNADRVIHLSSFAKTIAPSLRIGFLTLPPRLQAAFASAKWLADRGNAPFEQAVLAAFIGEGFYDQHLRRMARSHAAKRRAVIDGLREAFGEDVVLAPSVTGTEFVAWFRKLKFTETGRFVAEAAALGVGIYSVAPYYLKPPTRCGLVFGFAALAERDIEPALARLGDAYRKVLRRR